MFINKNVTDCYDRTGMRWAIDIPAGATVNNAVVVICAPSDHTATTCPARVGVLLAADTIAFGSNEFATLDNWNATGATSWSAVPVQNAAGQLDATPDIATAVQTRIQDGSYTPAGSDPNNYVAVSLADNGDQTSAQLRGCTLYDNTQWPGPILVAKYTHSSLKRPYHRDFASTGSFMAF